MTSLIFFAIAIPISIFVGLCNRALAEQFAEPAGSRDNPTNERA